MNTIDEFCVGCRRKMKVAKVGQEVLELTERGVPYKCMSGDVLECPVCGCRVVTRFGKVTPCHEEGFDELVPGQELSVADSPEEFAQRVIELLDDAPQRDRLGWAARRFVEERYDWRLIVPRFERIYEKLRIGS